MKKKLSLLRLLASPLLLLVVVAGIFSYPIVTLKKFFNHPEFINYYPSFRHWFLQEWLKGTFPKWNPYWGVGHTTDIEATIPIDIYSFLEFFFGPKYHYFQAIQFTVLLTAAYYAYRKLKISPWIAALSSLTFFFSPWVLHHVFMFTWMSILTGVCFITPQVLLYFQTQEKKRLVFLTAAIGFTLLGTRPDFWFFILTYTSGLILFSAVFYRKWTFLPRVFLSVFAGVVLHAWQIVPLVQILQQSNRVKGMGLSALLEPVFYQRLYLSLIHFNPVSLFNLYGLGALLGLITWYHLAAPKRSSMLKALLCFLPLAYYWCRKELGDVAEMDGMKLAPPLLHAYFGFIAFFAATSLEKNRQAKILYCLIIFLFLMRDQGQVILSHIIGLTWIPTRDNFLFDFLFAALAGMALSHSKFKVPLVATTFVWFFFAIIPAPYYSQWELKPAPPFFGKYEGLVGADEVVKALKDSPEWRAFFTSPGGWEANSLRNRANEVTLYSSMINARYRDWTIYRRFGIRPEEGWSSHPADYTPSTIQELPPKNTKGFENNIVYWWKLRAWPPQEIAALRLLGVKHIISETPFPSLPWFTDHKKIGLFYTAKLRNPAPRAFVIEGLPDFELENFKSNLSAKSDGNVINFDNRLLLASPSRINRYEPHEVTVEVESKMGGIFVLTDLYHPFWSAKVDGKNQEIFPALYTFRGVRIPAGKHRIDFICDIPFFFWGCLVSWFVFILWVVCASLIYFSAKRPIRLIPMRHQKSDQYAY